MVAFLEFVAVGCGEPRGLDFTELVTEKFELLTGCVFGVLDFLELLGFFPP